MIFSDKAIKTRYGYKEILSIKFETPDEYKNTMKYFSEIHTQLNKSGEDVVVIGGFEEFMTAFSDHYNERYNNTFFWYNTIDTYKIYIEKYLKYDIKR